MDVVKPVEEPLGRIRLPREGEVLGIVEDFLGGDKVKVKCNDGNTRICRIPGRLRKKIWMRINDVVMIEPWKVQTKERGDVVWVYNPTQASWLKRQGHIK